MTGKHWTEEELSILKDSNKKLTIEEIIDLLPNRTKSGIIDKMRNLGLKTSKYQNRWSKNDIAILLKCNDMKTDEVMKLLPNRSRENIRDKARELNINLRLPNSWEDYEIEILRHCSVNKTGIEKMKELLPHRTIKAIQAKLILLKLSYDTSNTRKGITKDNEYLKKQARIFRYKNRYGIVLDYEKDYDTHSPFQWWKWSFYGAPNGKKLNNIPIEIVQSEEKSLEIVKQVLVNEMNINSRDKCLELKFNDLAKYRIKFRSIRDKQLHDILNTIFPEYNIRPFELKNVPLGYWKIKENCDEYFRYVLEEIFVISEFNDVKTELPPLLSFTQMRALKLNGLTYPISTYRHYESMYHWVNHLYPELCLQAEDFKEHLGFDGVKLNSSEEVIIYNLIKRDLGVNIKSTGLGKSFKFYDEENDNAYIPDFLIKHNDKQIILEYFGLFRENYGKSKILKDYYYKTLDKISYFSTLDDYGFIYILHDEIKNLDKLSDKIKKELNIT